MKKGGTCTMKGMMEEKDSPAEASQEYGKVSGSMNTNGGKSPETKRYEKHGLKSGFFTKKVLKGQG